MTMIKYKKQVTCIVLIYSFFYEPRLINSFSYVKNTILFHEFQLSKRAGGRHQHTQSPR